MWLIGGWNPRDMEHFPRMCNNEVWSSADGREWILEKPNTFHGFGKTFNRLSDWAGRHCSGYVVHQDRMWIVGGDPNQGHYHNDVWNSDDGRIWHYGSEDGVNWTELPGTPWKPRHAASVFVHDNALWMVTGNNMESDVWKCVKS